MREQSHEVLSHLESDYDKDLMFFIQHKISTKMTEQQVNDQCINYIKSRMYQHAESTAVVASQLIPMIYDWGYYPTETINYCNSFKTKANFDEITNPNLTEILFDRLIKLAREHTGSISSKPYFKLMAS